MNLTHEKGLSTMPNENSLVRKGFSHTLKKKLFDPIRNVGNERDHSIYLTLPLSKVLRNIRNRYTLTNPRGLLKDRNMDSVTV